MKITTRAGWGAKAPKSRITTVWGRRTEFVVHHSEGPTTASVRSIQDFHMGPQRGWSDVAYNFLCRDDGTIYEGRGWLTVGAHATGHNTSGIGVCYIGQNAPTDAAKRSIRAL
ncbi:MAG: N-acetylmuramoyl-L-alanine amidase, partial [Streptosporangiaceae bacterium]